MEKMISICKKNKIFILLFFSVLSGILILRLFLSILGRVPTENYRILTELSIEVQHKDGTEEKYNSHLFNFSSKEDKIIIHIPLKKEWKQNHQAINFFFYNSVIKAYYKDSLLISYGENLKRHMIGNQKVCIPVPLDAYGEEIRVEIFPKLDFMENNFESPVLMEEENSVFFSIIGQETSYAIFVMTLVASFLAMVIFAFFSLGEGFWMMTMIFAITLWHLGNSGMMYMLSNCEDLSAVCEYIGMYLLLSSAPLYGSYETERPFVRKYLRFSGFTLFFLFILSLFLYFLPTGYSYVWNLRWAQAFQLVMLLSTIVSLLFPGRVVKNSLIFVAILGVMEQFRIILSAKITDKWPVFMQWFIKIHYSKVLILLMIFIFITAYSFKLITVMQKNMEEKHLRVLAYSDNLTGIGNRQYLQRKMNLLDNQHFTNYAVIFIDINDLKFTNDYFGHDCGDQLIKMVATAIKEAVNASGGFCGRSGGDEFLAFIFPENYSFTVAEQIRENLKKKRFVSLSVIPTALPLTERLRKGFGQKAELPVQVRLFESRTEECMSKKRNLRKTDKKRKKGKEEEFSVSSFLSLPFRLLSSRFLFPLSLFSFSALSLLFV